MSGQFELGSAHLEYKNQAVAAMTGITVQNSNEVIKELYKKSFGFLPADNTVYKDYLGLVVSMEEIAKINPDAASLLVDQIVFQELLNGYGTANSKNLFNINEIIAVLCLEPGVSILGSLNTKAVKTSTGWNVQGKKSISKEQQNADKFVVFAKDEEEKTRVFIVSKVNVNKLNKTIAGSNISLGQAEINADLTEKDCIAVINDNYERVMSIARTLVASVAVGIGHSALVSATAACKETKGTDGQAISNKQSAQFTLADMFGELEAGRILTYYSANLIDSNNTNIKQATMAKVQATDAAASISLQALQILGNMGYIADTDFANMMQAAVNTQIKGGTNRVQKNLIYQYMLAKK